MNRNDERLESLPQDTVAENDKRRGQRFYYLSDRFRMDRSRHDGRESGKFERDVLDRPVGNVHDRHRRFMTSKTRIYGTVLVFCRAGLHRRTGSFASVQPAFGTIHPFGLDQPDKKYFVRKSIMTGGMKNSFYV